MSFSSVSYFGWKKAEGFFPLNRHKSSTFVSTTTKLLRISTFLRLDEKYFNSTQLNLISSDFFFVWDLCLNFNRYFYEEFVKFLGEANRLENLSYRKVSWLFKLILVIVVTFSSMRGNLETIRFCSHYKFIAQSHPVEFLYLILLVFLSTKTFKL